MLESDERPSIGLKERSEAESTLAKVKGFASDERFANVPPALRDAAVARAAFFIDAPDQVVDQQLEALYSNPKRNSFDRNEEEKFGTLEQVNKKYKNLFIDKVGGGMLDEEAGAFCAKRKKIDTALRYAKKDFAGIMKYSGNYEAITSDPDFNLAKTIVVEAVGKFG